MFLDNSCLYKGLIDNCKQISKMPFEEHKNVSHFQWFITYCRLAVKFRCYYLYENSLIPEIVEDLIKGAFVGTLFAANDVNLCHKRETLITDDRQRIYF